MHVHSNIYINIIQQKLRWLKMLHMYVHFSESILLFLRDIHYHNNIIILANGS